MAKFLMSLFLILCTLLTISCGGAPAMSQHAKLREISLTMPKLKKEYRMVYVSDLHIISDPQEAALEHHPTILNRKSSMINPGGETAEAYWLDLVKDINLLNPDVVLLGGDMVDYMSASNVSCLKEGLEKIKAPIIYVRADHDYANWYDQSLSSETVDTLSSTIDQNEEIIIHPLEEFTIVGIDNNTSQITPEALTRLEDFFSSNKKPVLLLTHVPFQSTLNTDLDTQSKKVWQDRALIWGKDCYYTPDGNTAKAIELILNPANQVKAVFTGHLHFDYEGQLTDTTMQYVMAPAYEGNLTLITINEKKAK